MICLAKETILFYDIFQYLSKNKKKYKNINQQKAMERERKRKNKNKHNKKYNKCDRGKRKKMGRRE